MYKSLFQNSKAALVFALLTIFGAVAMIGSAEDSGVVLKAVSVAKAQGSLKASKAQGGSTAASAPPASVFGAYTPQQGQGAAAPVTPASGTAVPVTPPSGAGVPVTAAPGAGTGEAFNPMKAPLSPGAVVNPSQ